MVALTVCTTATRPSSRCCGASCRRSAAAGSGASTTSGTVYTWDDWSVVLCARWFLWPAALLQEAANATAATTTTNNNNNNDDDDDDDDAADNSTSASPFDGPASDAGIVQYLWWAMAFVLTNQVRFQWGDAAQLALANTDWSGMRLRRRIEAAALAVVVPVLLWTLPVSSVITFGELRCVRDGRPCDCRGVRYDTCTAPICFASLVACRRATVAGLCISSRVVMFQRQWFFWRTERHVTTPVCWFSPIQHSFMFYFVSSFDLFDVCAVLCVCVHACVRARAPPRSYIGNAASGFAARSCQSAPCVAHSAATVATLWLVGPMREAMTELCRRSRSHAVSVIHFDVSSMVFFNNATRDAELLHF